MSSRGRGSRHDKEERALRLFRQREPLQKLRPIFSRLLGSETVTHDVFSHDPRDNEVQQVIFSAGFGAAATHLKSAEWMAAYHGAGAGAIDVNISSYDFSLGSLDVRRAT